MVARQIGSVTMKLNETDSYELLKGVIAIAAADGSVTGREKAIIKELAERARVSRISTESMIDQARKASDAVDKLFTRALKNPKRAMQLLVAAANIDGTISDEENNLLADVSLKLGLSPEAFGEVFKAGVASSKRVDRQD